jgi:hypothetical protein
MNIPGPPKFLMLSISKDKQVSTSFYDVVKACQNLHIEEHHQLKILLQKYEQLFDGTLKHFNMETPTN